MDSLLAPLFDSARLNSPECDLVVLEAAYEVAKSAHAGQKRKSGEEYITHPVAVTEILAGLGMDQATLVAALLHDTVEDTQYHLEELRRDFGEEVASLVDGVTKLDKLTYGPTAEAQTLRKMVVAMSKDIRVLVIKLADRLHNARTWGFVNPESAARKARETLDIYAPLAHRLGMNAIKWELEDLSFSVLEPKKFEEIARLVNERSPMRAKFSEEVTAVIEADLLKEGIKASVKSRQKHLYSVFQKMVVRGREFNEIYDLVGIRVIVDDVRDCYAVLGSIHARWSPIPGRFKDYIAMPKFNLYQSLHTTVIGPNGKAVEIQIRTTEMHARAEFGIAAHWKYKSKVSGTPDSDPGVMWLKQLHEWQDETENVSDFLNTLRYDLRTPEVFVFTPKGSVIALPAGSTPVDFAYAVHTEVGNRCVGAKVNGKLIPLESALTNGDVVDIVTNKGINAAPSRDWLNFVKSPRARSKIKAWFSKERKEEAIEAGQESIARQMRKAGLPLQKIMAGQAILEIAHDLHYQDVEELYAAVGNGHVSAASVVEKLAISIGEVIEEHDESLDHLIRRPVAPKRNSSGVDVQGVDDVIVKLARCCTPVPGDSISGFVTRGSGVSVHRLDCINMKDLRDNQGDRIVSVKWNTSAKSLFLVNIQVEALDRSGLLSDITRTLSEQHVNILNASVSTSKDRVAISRFTFEMADALHLDAVLSAVRNVEGVYDVYRVTNN
jgi:GTP pyrophosphokinase